jgi:hypothetical protein
MIDVGDVDDATNDLIALRHSGAAVVPVPRGVAMATAPSTFLVVSSVRVAAALLLLLLSSPSRSRSSRCSLSPTDTTSREPSFPTTSPSRRSSGRSCHHCPPPCGHPHQARARRSHHPHDLDPELCCVEIQSHVALPFSSRWRCCRVRAAATLSFSPASLSRRLMSSKPSLGATAGRASPSRTATQRLGHRHPKPCRDASSPSLRPERRHDHLRRP